MSPLQICFSLFLRSGFLYNAGFGICRGRKLDVMPLSKKSAVSNQMEDKLEQEIPTGH